jgi:hypothetical protein
MVGVIGEARDLSLVLNLEMRESGNERVPRSHMRVYNKLGR